MYTYIHTHSVTTFICVLIVDSRGGNGVHEEAEMTGWRYNRDEIKIRDVEMTSEGRDDGG